MGILETTIISNYKGKENQSICIELEHLMVLNNSAKIIINKSFKNCLLVESDSKFYANIKSLIFKLAHQQKNKSNLFSLSKNIHQSNINVTKSKNAQEYEGSPNKSKSKIELSIIKKININEKSMNKVSYFENLQSEKNENLDYSFNEKSGNQLIDSNTSKIKGLFSDINKSNNEKAISKYNSNINSESSLSDENEYKFSIINIDHTIIIILIINGLNLVGLFSQSSKIEESKLLMMYYYVTICNFNFNPSVFKNKFLDIKDNDLIKLRAYEIIWVKIIYKHFQFYASSLYSSKEILEHKTVLKYFYLISLNNSTTDNIYNNILLNIEFNKNTVDAFDYIKNKKLLNELIFQGNILMKRFNDGKKNNSKKINLEDFNQNYLKLEFSSTYPRIIIYMKFIPILNGCIIVHLYIQFKLSRSKSKKSLEFSSPNINKINTLNSFYFNNNSEYKEVNIMILPNDRINGSEKENSNLSNMHNSQDKIENNEDNQNNQNNNDNNDNNENNNINKIKKLKKNANYGKLQNINDYSYDDVNYLMVYEEDNALFYIFNFLAEFYFTCISNSKFFYNRDFMPKYYHQDLLLSLDQNCIKMRKKYNECKLNINIIHFYINRDAIVELGNDNKNVVENYNHPFLNNRNGSIDSFLKAHAFFKNCKENEKMLYHKVKKNSDFSLNSQKKNSSSDSNPCPLTNNQYDNLELLVYNAIRNVFLDQEDYIKNMENNNKISSSDDDFIKSNDEINTSDFNYNIDKRKILKIIIKFLHGLHESSSFYLSDPEHSNMKTAKDIFEITKQVSNLSVDFFKNKLNNSNSHSFSPRNNKKKNNKLNPRSYQRSNSNENLDHDREKVYDNSLNFKMNSFGHEDNKMSLLLKKKHTNGVKENIHEI